VAFAAQKSLENLFGGFVVLSDKAVHVGDFVRVGSVLGGIEDVTLYATRIRTLERIVVSIPNGILMTSQIENLSRRDKFLFRHTLGLTYGTTAAQVCAVVDGCRARLAADARVEPGTLSVRFAALSAYSLDVQVFAYVLVPDWATFLAAQQELLLVLMDVVEEAGSALAFPTSTTYFVSEPKGAEPPSPNQPAEPR
jgi:MscS family membrane protein